MSEIIKNMVTEGEFIVINNLSPHSHPKTNLNLTSQIALILSSEKFFFGFNINKKPNILVINSEKMGSENFFESMISQIDNIEDYLYENINVINVNPNLLINATDIEDFSYFIKDSTYDIIIWNNINDLQDFFNSYFKKIESSDNSLDHIIYIIKKISGMKTKIISHLYSNILDKENFQKINNIAGTTASLFHKNIIEGYILEFENQNNDNKSISKLEFIEDKNRFTVIKTEMFEKNIKVKEITY